MGNTDSKIHFRKAFVELSNKPRPVDPNDEKFWDQFWIDYIATPQDIYTLVPGSEIRQLRNNSPNNLATLCYKAVEKIVSCVDCSCRTSQDQQNALNSVRLLSRIIPYMLEDADWRAFFWSTLPSSAQDTTSDDEAMPLAKALISALCDLLFCPDFTVPSSKGNGPDKAEDLHSVDSCEYIWEAGVGFSQSSPVSVQFDSNRTEILRLLIACFSESMYVKPEGDDLFNNKWIEYFSSVENRHALPLFTSLLNTVFSYNPVGIGLPYNHLLFTDKREMLVEAALQILIIVLDHDLSTATEEEGQQNVDNLFINYISRLHRDEDLQFILRGFVYLLNNPLTQTYLPHSAKKVKFHQELLILFWRMCDYNKKFLFFVLKSGDVLDVLVPVLYHLNDSRSDNARIGLMHISVFILLLLSGERNFGVRLNKPFSSTASMDIPIFSGTHADLLIIIFHKVITMGHQGLHPLFECLLTVLVNVSPYLKTISMIASTKLLHLFEAFTTPWFLLSSPSNYHLVFFLLETFNNIIQYQFDGNSNLIYTIIRKRHVFHSLANMPVDQQNINKHISKKPFLDRKTERKQEAKIRKRQSRTSTDNESQSDETSNRTSLDGSEEQLDSLTTIKATEPGTLQASLASTPRIERMTEKESGHPKIEQVNQSVQRDGEIAAKSGVSEGLFDFNDEDHEDDAVEECPNQTKKLSENHSGNANPKPNIASRDLDTSMSQLSLEEHDKSWIPTTEWVTRWKSDLPLQTVLRLLQVLVPQVEKICVDRGLTDENEILRFLKNGTLVGLLPVPHPILIRKYQTNIGTAMWFRTYLWGVIYLRTTDPPWFYDTKVKLFEIQKI